MTAFDPVWQRNGPTEPLPDTLELSRQPLAFHRKLPSYEPTPLVDASAVADRLGLARVVVKDESRRFGMPSFKLLGASWATYRALVQHTGAEPPRSNTSNTSDGIDWLRDHFASLRPFALAAATDGNHGRAVARMAKLLDFEARIFVPAGTTAPRIAGIESEGADVSVVDGDYDETVARSAEEAGPRCLVIDDTSWPGYEDVPRWVVEGYATIFYEIAEQLDAPADALFVPLGVGALGAAAVDYFVRNTSTAVIGVEPTTCACVLESLRARTLVTVPGPHPSMMAGLNCGTPSPIAFPTLLAGLGGSIAIEDAVVEDAMRTLSACGVTSGETGAAALGGLEAMMAAGNPMGFDATTTAIVLSTEGATDPDAYERIVGRKPA